MAIDDLGAGFAGLDHLTERRPDVVKLDRELVSGLETRPLAQALAGTVARYAESTGALVIGEDVEEEPEALALQLAALPRARVGSSGGPRSSLSPQ